MTDINTKGIQFFQNEYPEKKIELIEREYWLCGHPRHKHTSERSAKKCIIEGKNKLKEAPVKSKLTRREANDLRAKGTKKDVVAMCLNAISGQTFKAEGAKFGVSGSRARQIFHETKHKIDHPKYRPVNEDRSVIWVTTIAALRKNKKAAENFRQRLYLWEHEDEQPLAEVQF